MATLNGTLPLQYVDREIFPPEKLPSMSFISKKVLQFIIAHQEIKTVLLAGRWSYYTGYMNQYDKHIILSPTKKEWAKYAGNNFLLLEKGLRATIFALQAAHKKVVLVTDVPLLEKHPANLMALVRYTGRNLNDITPKRVIYESNNKAILTLFKKLKNEDIVDEIIPVHERFFLGNKIIIEENNHLLYRDDDHLSYWGSMKVADLFDKYMKNNN
jgi:hypothetical protein